MATITDIYLDDLSMPIEEYPTASIYTKKVIFLVRNVRLEASIFGVVPLTSDFVCNTIPKKYLDNVIIN
jgi:hypothetical protein